MVAVRAEATSMLLPSKTSCFTPCMCVVMLALMWVLS